MFEDKTLTSISVQYESMDALHADSVDTVQLEFSMDLVLGCTRDPSRKLFFLHFLVSQREAIFRTVQKKLDSLLN